jgi:hypothetical protein
MDEKKHTEKAVGVQVSYLKMHYLYLSWHMTLCQLCATVCDSQSQPDVIQRRIEPVPAVMPLALR